LLESALALGINYWDTARVTVPAKEWLLPSFHAIGTATWTGVCRLLRTDHIDLYNLHYMRSHESANLSAIESGAVRAAREAKDKKIIRSFGVTGHSGAGILIECIKRFDPDAVLTIFPCTRPDKGRYEDELLPLARARKMGVIAMKTNPIRASGEPAGKVASPLRAEPRWGQYGNRGIGWPGAS
jgi:aryl-alcohol dehydrogenase-like predicted oxidoreductase